MSNPQIFTFAKPDLIDTDTNDWFKIIRFFAEKVLNDTLDLTRLLELSFPSSRHSIRVTQ